ncbi:hypothetical protein [Lewinella sp. W8]|uniref:hypothetical protein n=1 Tax=Lewinella sp. W8 TaxID=2528208 RepID=UPI0012B550A3|nr:hypothetical protein [Lewinella sp. W8]MTB49463.1 hypothetical protein [Lewinella sp. W8]
MKTKVEKRNQARKQAEAIKAARKSVRQAKGQQDNNSSAKKKGKSMVPQSKSRSKAR